MTEYLENLYRANPDDPIRQALSTRHNFRVIMEKLNATMAVVDNLVFRSTYVFNDNYNLDSTHPFTMDFELTEDMSSLIEAKVSFKVRRFSSGIIL